MRWGRASVAGMKIWHWMVALGAVGVVAVPVDAQARRSTSAYICWLERSSAVEGYKEYFYSGPLRNFSQTRPNEYQLMRDAFEAEVYRRAPSRNQTRDLICKSWGATSTAERELARIPKGWAESNPRMVPHVHMTGWTYDFTGVSQGEARGDPGPAVRLVAPGETPRSERPAVMVDETAGHRAVAGAYAVQQKRYQAQIDRERAEKAAYEKQLAATRAAEADYARRVAAFEAQQAQYAKARAEWEAQVAACKAGNSKACSGQAVQVD